MKKVILITSRSDTLEKTQILIENIQNFKNLNYDIILSSNYEVDSIIQNSVDYYFFQKDNKLIDVTILNYAKQKGFKMHCLNKIKQHSYAHFNLIKNGLKIAKSLNYDIVHFVNYDIILNDIQSILNEHSKYLEKFNGVFYYYNNDYLKTQILSYQSVFFSVKVDWATQKTNLINSPKEYIETCDNALEFVVGILFNDNIKILDNFNNIIKNDKLIGIEDDILCMVANDGDNTYTYMNNNLDIESNIKIITNKKIINKTLKPRHWSFIKLGEIDYVFFISEDNIFYKVENIDESFKSNNRLDWSKPPDYIKINVDFDNNKVFLSSEKNININLKILRNSNKTIYVKNDINLTNNILWFSPNIKISESNTITIKIETNNICYEETFTQNSDNMNKILNN